MIKLQNSTPSVYYNHSRDFQYIGRLYDVVLNYVKTNSDLLETIIGSSIYDRRFIELLLTTLGFNIKADYNLDQLVAVSQIFSKALHNKGTTTAIYLVCNAMLAATGETNSVYVELQDNVLKIALNSKYLDMRLLRDVLDYILPAGISVKFVKQFVITQDTQQDSYSISSDLKTKLVYTTTASTIDGGVGPVAEVGNENATLRQAVLHTVQNNTLGE